MKKKVKAKTKRSLVSIVDKVILKFAKMGEENWIKGVAAKDKTGCYVDPRSRKACKFCNEGALLNVIRNRNIDFNQINAAWYRAVGLSMLSSNDQSGTTFGSNLWNWVKVRKYLADQEKKAA